MFSVMNIFLMPSFSGTAIWFVQKANFALSCSI